MITIILPVQPVLPCCEQSSVRGACFFSSTTSKLGLVGHYCDIKEVARNINMICRPGNTKTHIIRSVSALAGQKWDILLHDTTHWTGQVSQGAMSSLLLLMRIYQQAGGNFLVIESNKNWYKRMTDCLNYIETSSRSNICVKILRGSDSGHTRQTGFLKRFFCEIFWSNESIYIKQILEVRTESPHRGLMWK